MAKEAVKKTLLSFDDFVLLTPTEASKKLKIPVTTLQKWRSTGENNIPFVKIGRSVRYLDSALNTYVENHVVGGL